MHTIRNQQVLSKVVAVKLLKKYRLLWFAKTEFWFLPKWFEFDRHKLCFASNSKSNFCNLLVCCSTERAGKEQCSAI